MITKQAMVQQYKEKNNTDKTFKSGDQVNVIGGSYEKHYDVHGTVVDMCHAHSQWIKLTFDIPQTGNTAVQRIKSPLTTTKLSKKYVELISPPENEKVGKIDKESHVSSTVTTKLPIDKTNVGFKIGKM